MTISDNRRYFVSADIKFSWLKGQRRVSNFEPVVLLPHHDHDVISDLMVERGNARETHFFVGTREDILKEFPLTFTMLGKKQDVNQLFDHARSVDYYHNLKALEFTNEYIDTCPSPIHVFARWLQAEIDRGVLIFKDIVLTNHEVVQHGRAVEVKAEIDHAREFLKLYADREARRNAEVWSTKPSLSLSQHARELMKEMVIGHLGLTSLTREIDIRNFLRTTPKSEELREDRKAKVKLHTYCPETRKLVVEDGVTRSTFFAPSTEDVEEFLASYKPDLKDTVAGIREKERRAVTDTAITIVSEEPMAQEVEVIKHRTFVPSCTLKQKVTEIFDSHEECAANNMRIHDNESEMPYGLLLAKEIEECPIVNGISLAYVSPELYKFLLGGTAREKQADFVVTDGKSWQVVQLSSDKSCGRWSIKLVNCPDIKDGERVLVSNYHVLNKQPEEQRGVLWSERSESWKSSEPVSA